MEVAERIQRFITEDVLFGDAPASLTPQTPLLDGLIDSLGLMELVAFLEDEFGVEVNDEDITADRFRTVADIERLVIDKGAGKAGAE